jgi:hypothetical protein
VFLDVRLDAANLGLRQRAAQPRGRKVAPLIPARYVKAYLKTNKNDLRDAEAICEGLQRPTMHFVAMRRPAVVLALYRWSSCPEYLGR